MPLPIAPASPEFHLNERNQMQYLLGNPPSWMMRYGISVISVFFVLMLVFAWIIRYPDIVESKIVLTTVNPPIRILAKTNGRITALMAQDKQPVKEGQTIAVIENTANYRDVLLLENWLNEAGNNSVPMPQSLQLGSLQQAYSIFSEHWKDYHYFNSSPGAVQKVEGINKQIERLQEINNNLIRQKNIMEQEFAITTKTHERQAKLFEGKVISDLEFEKSTTNWLQEKRQIEAAAATVLQNQLQIRQLEESAKDVQFTHADTRNEKELALAEDLLKLKSEVAAWKQQYLLTAPITGQLSFQKIWSTQQSVTTGEEVFAVVPDGKSSSPSANIFGRALVSGTQFGKIQPNMKVLIRLDGFPAQQYGAIEGAITNLAALPQNENYIVDVSLPGDLTTSYGKPIPFRQEMSGTAQIITEDRRIIDRIFDRLRDLIKN